MKKLLLICSIFLLGNSLLNAQSLVAGDIAIIGCNEDAGPVGTEDHSFTWIALTDIPAGEVIYFTDQGVDMTLGSWLGNTENHYSWTAPGGGLSCGSIVHIYEDGSSNNLIALGGGTMSGILFGSGWNLSSGDQVLAYQAAGARSALGSTTFITGLHMNDDLGYGGKTNGWTNIAWSSTGVAMCHLPPGLTNGVNCLSMVVGGNSEWDNTKYTGTLTGTSTVLRALINAGYAGGNWYGDNGTNATVGISVGDYSPSVTCVAGCSEPDVPTVSASPSSVCPGTNSTLTISGNLNDATQWAVYTGSCGGTLLGTTATTTFVVTPSTTTTYYVRGEGGCASAGSCGSVSVTAADAVNPTISCPGTQSQNANASCQATLADYTGLATVSDNCTASPTVTQSPVAGTTISANTIVTLTATDGSSNTANCNFIVNLVDVTNPTISCPSNQSLNANASCQATLPDYTGSATAADNCTGSPTVTQSPVAGTTIGLGGTTVTLTATDGSANTANCNFTVTVNDVTNPTISCPSNQTLNANASCQATLPDYTGSATAADNCTASPTVTQSPAAGTTVGLGGTTVTLTATDGSSNTANCNFTVTVNDVTNPTITCPGNQIENPDASCNFTLPDYTGLAVVSDNCTASPAVTQSPVAGTVISGTTTITMTATDGASNTGQCTFDVTLNDASAPTAVCQNINAYLDGAGNATIVAADLDGGSTDNCSGLTFSASATVFTCADLGPNNVTLTVTDGNANSSNCVAVVTIIDTISPAVTCPGNQVGAPTTSCQFTLPDYTGLATASDNCNPAPTVTQSPVAGTAVGLGSTTVTLTAEDGSGNTSSCTFNVTVSSSITGIHDESICNGGSVDVNGTTYSAATSLTGTEIFTAANGCDSVVTVTITELPALTGTHDESICFGGSVDVNGTTYSSATSLTGTETFTGGACDSVVTVTITELPLLTGIQNETVCFGGSIDVNGTTFDAGNLTGVVTFTNVGPNNNCDSLVTVTLTIEAAVDATVDNTLAPTLTANQTGAAYQWVDCDNANAPIPLATNASYTATVNGNYAVEVTVGLCMVTSGCENITGVGVKEVASNVVSIHPNPTKGMFTISLTNANQAISYTVTTLEGRIVEQANNVTQRTIEVDLTNESKGVYFLIIQENDTNTTHKIIRQ